MLYIRQKKKQSSMRICATLFANHLWSLDLHSSSRRMRVAFNDKFRMLFDLLRYASAGEHQVTFNIVKFFSLIRKQLFSFIFRLMQSLVLSSCFFTSPYWKHYENMLFLSKLVLVKKCPCQSWFWITSGIT